MAAPRRIFVFRLSSPGATPAKRLRPADRASLSESAGHVRPFAFGGLYDAARVGQKRGARLLAVEKIEPFSGYSPNQGMAWHRPPTPDRKRIIPAEARRIHLRMAREGAPIALVRETPDRPVQIQFDLGTAK